MAYPALYDENSCRRCHATNMQKMITGAMINNNVTSSDLASGPNINLPPRMNFCKGQIERKVNIKLTSRERDNHISVMELDYNNYSRQVRGISKLIISSRPLQCFLSYHSNENHQAISGIKTL